MAKKPKKIPEPPSKAYLVSFGDTMTALLAFFIVINSMAKEQTGANLYSGTGSFVNAVDSIGISGTSPTTNSKNVIKKSAQLPIYALAENLKNNEHVEGSQGPDDEHDNERKLDRDKENFQRFIHEVERQYGLKKKEPFVDQVVFDSFELFKEKGDGLLSDHAIQLGSEIFPTLRDDKKSLEIIIWATMPSPVIINKFLKKSVEIRKEVESKFWIKPDVKDRIRYNVKPWLFSDAKRPVLSFVVQQTE